MEDSTKLPLWLPTAYFGKGLPRVVVFVVALLLLRQLGLGVAESTACVALGYLPWVLKPCWQAAAERSLSPRVLACLCELLLVVVFLLLARALPAVDTTVALLVAVAALSAVHNVAVDRLFALTGTTYRLAREVCRKLAVVIGEGLLVVLVGNLQVVCRTDRLNAWRVAFYALAALFLVLCLWHAVTMPRAGLQRSGRREGSTSSGFEHRNGGCDVERVHGNWRSFLWFFFYPLGVALIGKVAILFLVESVRHGGLGLSPQGFALVMGTMGIVGYLGGNLLGQKTIDRRGWGSSRGPLSLCMLLPAAVYCGLSLLQPQGLFLVGACVMAEQAAYGLGFSVYLYSLRLAPHRAFAKAVMALSFMVGCLLSEPLQQLLGYGGLFLVALGMGCAVAVVLHRQRDKLFPDS